MTTRDVLRAVVCCLLAAVLSTWLHYGEADVEAWTRGLLMGIGSTAVVTLLGPVLFR